MYCCYKLNFAVLSILCPRCIQSLALSCKFYNPSHIVVSPSTRLSHLNELIFGAKLCDQHVLPITDTCERHAQSAADECVCIFRQVSLQARAQHFNEVKCRMQRAKVALPGLLSNLNHIPATFICNMKTHVDKTTHED